MLPRSKSLPLKETLPLDEDAQAEIGTHPKTKSLPSSPRAKLAQLGHFFRKVSKNNLAVERETNIPTIQLGLFSTKKAGKTTLINYFLAKHGQSLPEQNPTLANEIQLDASSMYAYTQHQTMIHFNQEKLNLVIYEIYHLPKFIEHMKKAKLRLNAAILMLNHKVPEDLVTFRENQLHSCASMLKKSMACSVSLAINFADTCLAGITQLDVDDILQDDLIQDADFISAKTGQNVSVFLQKVLDSAWHNALNKPLDTQDNEVMLDEASLDEMPLPQTYKVRL